MQTLNDTTANASDPMVRPLHTFTKSGMGSAPFRFVGVASIPSPSLAGENPTAYNNALQALPRNLENGCGTCAHCGTGIMNIFIVRNAAGKLYGVGCDCIEKTGDKPMVRASHLAKLEADRAKRAARKEAKRIAYLAEIDPATGETNEQRIERETQEHRAAYAAREASEMERRKTVSEALGAYAALLRDGRGGFRDSVGADMQAGYLPTGRGREIAVEILAKQFGRFGSKNYHVAAEQINAKFDSLA
jgi:hypothetical protein